MEWYVIYYRRPDVNFWWSKRMNPDYRHVELWRPTRFGPESDDVLWTVMRPTFEFLEVETTLDAAPPWLRYPEVVTAWQKVQTFGRRSQFLIGPPTCVEFTKSALGIRNFWIRTPFQLFKFIEATRQQR